MSYVILTSVYYIRQNKDHQYL